MALDAGAGAALQSLGIAAAPIGADSLAFPITGGRVNASSYAGTIDHRGGIALSRGATRVELTEFTIDIDGTPELTALVGGTRVAILSVDLSALKASASGRTITLDGRRAEAHRGRGRRTQPSVLHHRVHRGPAPRHRHHRSQGGLTMRTLLAASRRCSCWLPRPRPAPTAPRRSSSTRARSPRSPSLGVAPAPIAPATATSTGELAFPITNAPFGALLSGTIRHSGGIALTAGATTVKLENFNIDPLRRQLTAVVGGGPGADPRARLLARPVGLGGGTLRLGPVAGSLTAVAAGALDGAFGLPAGTVPPGLKLGDATVRYRLY